MFHLDLDFHKTPKQDLVEEVVADACLFATWKQGGVMKRKGLAMGRHLVGNSAVCAVQAGDAGRDIAGAIEIDGTGVRVRCMGVSPVLFADGRKMSLGEAVTVADVMEITVGRVPVVLTRVSLPTGDGTAPRPDQQEKNKKKARGLDAEDSLQSVVDHSLQSVDLLKQTLSRKLLDQLNLTQIDLKSIESNEVRETARLRLRKMLAEVQFPAEFPLTKEELEDQTFDEVMGLGPLESLLADVKVTEIMVNRRDQIFLERAGQLTLSPVVFSSDQALLNVIERIVSQVGRRIDASSPIVDARLVDGSRVNAVIPPLAIKGPCLTIRRFSKKPIQVSQLIEWGSMTEEMANFLQYMVRERKNVMISGGTGSGKTTLLNALSSFIPNGERLVTVEDAAELQLQQDHVISLETRPANLEGNGAVTIRDLVKNCLRMRPDRIIVGECRGGEALDMLQAMNTGHDGSMTTAHANTPEDMLRRLETMVLMAGMDLPLRAIREQVSSALNLVVQQTRRKTGRRFVTHIAWIRGLNRSTGEYDLINLFHRDRSEAAHINWDALQEMWSTEDFPGQPREVVEKTFFHSTSEES